MTKDSPIDKCTSCADAEGYCPEHDPRGKGTRPPIPSSLADKLASRIRAWRLQGLERTPEVEAMDFAELVASELRLQPSPESVPQDRNELLRDMRCQVEYTDVATMPIPLYERIKAAVAQRTPDRGGLAEKLAATKHDAPDHPRGVGFNEGLDAGIDIVRQHFFTGEPLGTSGGDHSPASTLAGHLLKHGPFTSHSGLQLPDKIDCDALTPGDWDAAAAWFSARLTFGKVVGVPRGGVAFAHALEKYATAGPTLIADDVLTTGRSMEEARKVHPGAIGVVLFSRTPDVPDWIAARFVEQAGCRSEMRLLTDEEISDDDPAGDAYAKGYADGYKAKALSIEPVMGEEGKREALTLLHSIDSAELGSRLATDQPCLDCDSYSAEIGEIVRVARDNPSGLGEFLQLNFPREWGLSTEEHRAILDDVPEREVFPPNDESLAVLGSNVPEREDASMDQPVGSSAALLTRIEVWSLRPQPGTPEGDAWERGCHQGHEWGLQDASSTVREFVPEEEAVLVMAGAGALARFERPLAELDAADRICCLITAEQSYRALLERFEIARRP